MSGDEYEKLKKQNKWRDLQYRIEDHLDVDRVFRAVVDSEIPALHFKPEWDVKITPPFGGAMMRFVVNYNGRYVSVYCDYYSNLGIYRGAEEWFQDKHHEPYWEMYPRTYKNDGEPYTDTMRFALADADKLIENIDAELRGEPVL